MWKEKGNVTKKTCCKSDSNPLFPHEHHKQVQKLLDCCSQYIQWTSFMTHEQNKCLYVTNPVRSLPFANPPDVVFSLHWVSHNTDFYVTPDYSSHDPLHWLHTPSWRHRLHMHSWILSDTLYKPWTSSFRSLSIVLAFSTLSVSCLTKPFFVSSL